MSFQVTTAMVDMFSANVFHLSQQKMSRLRPFVRNENQNAETAFYDRIGLREARRKEGRHSDVVYIDTPHSRRAVTMIDFYDADLVDQEDKLRTIMNLENEYTQAIAMGLARQTDREIIDGALGDARGGRKGTEIIPLPDSQKVAAFIPGSGAGNAGDSIMIIFTTDTGGSADEVITFEPTLVSATATLTLANATAKSYVVVFTSNGTKWFEVSRTAVHL